MKKEPKTSIFRENKRLREKLDICRAWMKKEIKEKEQSSLFLQAQEGIQEILGRNIYRNLNKEEEQQLIESEMNFSYCSENPMIDASIVTMLYQKIFESYVHREVTLPWKKKINKKVWKQPNNTKSKALQNCIHKNYQLSFGKVLDIALTEAKNSDIEKDFCNFLSKHKVGDIISSHKEELMYVQKTRAFSSKRHAGRVSIEECSSIRDILIANDVSIFREFFK